MTPALHICYTFVTPLLHPCYTFITHLLHVRYTFVTPILYTCYTPCYTFVTPLLNICSTRFTHLLHPLLRLRYTIVTLIITILMHSYSVAFCSVAFCMGFDKFIKFNIDCDRFKRIEVKKVNTCAKLSMAMKREFLRSLLIKSSIDEIHSHISLEDKIFQKVLYTSKPLT